MTPQPPVPKEAIRALLEQAGIPGPAHDCVRLRGGGNNRAYRLDTEGGPVLLKEYFRHPEDPRDRAGAEYAFLSFCRDRDVARVPRPLAILRQPGLALYSWVEGASLEPGSVTDADVAEAAAFVGELARASDSPAAQSLSPAADSCFSVQEHLDRVESRLDSLLRALAQGSAEGQDDADREATSFVNGCLVPAWRTVRYGIEAAVADTPRRERLASAVCIASPSDFGFHNALRTADGLVFLDFEYAGLDDPAKLLCDFVCQPAVPAPPFALSALAEAVERNSTAAGKFLRRRAELLLPAHRIKWCCIMLNEFKRSDAERRRFAGVNLADNRAEQLQKTGLYFDAHCR